MTIRNGTLVRLMHRKGIFSAVDPDQKFKTAERMKMVGVDFFLFRWLARQRKNGIAYGLRKPQFDLNSFSGNKKPAQTGLSGNTKQMNMSTSKVKKSMVALILARKPVPQLITDTKHYLASMTGNTLFPNPTPALASISAALSLVEASYALAQTRVKGSALKLHTDVKALSIELRALAVYVETIANKDPDHAEEIIVNAGMVVKKPSVMQPKTFSLKLGKHKGEVLLDNKASLRGVYIYDMSTDPNLAEASWMRIYIGTKVKFTKSALTSGTKCFFRAASIVKNVQSNYSPVLSVIVQ